MDGIKSEVTPFHTGRMSPPSRQIIQPPKATMKAATSPHHHTPYYFPATF